MVDAGMNRKFVILFYFYLANPNQPELSQYHNFDPDPSHSSAASRRFPEQISAFSASKLCKTWSCGSGFFFFAWSLSGVHGLCATPHCILEMCNLLLVVPASLERCTRFFTAAIVLPPSRRICDQPLRGMSPSAPRTLGV